VPELAPDSSSFQSTRQVTIGQQGQALIRETVKVDGPTAAALRPYLKTVLKTDPEENRRDLIYQIIATGGVRAAVRSAKFVGVDTPQDPVILELEYEVPNCFAQSQNQLLGTVPACLERYFLRTQALAQRTSPFEVRIPLKYLTQTTIEPYPGTRFAAPPTTAPASADDVTKFGSAVVEYVSGADGKLTWKSEVHTTIGSYPAEDYAAFFRAREQMVKRMETPLTLVLAQQPTTAATQPK
jgi:hypothetical protein